MKLPRLNVSNWPLPDLVAFNNRVHGRVDPWFARRWVRRVTWTGLGLFTFFAAVWLYFASGLPSSQTLLAYQPPLPTNVRGYDGTPVQTFARERRVELSYDEFPPLVVNAFLSAEDKGFFTHPGIDFLGLAGAVVDYTAKSVTGGRAKGGSTITQQVAKYLLRDSSYNIGRKVREAILAFRLESALTKEQILELYLNSMFLGRNAYGVQAAARAYFDKDVGELTLPEAAYLAVLPKAPANYDPVRATQRALDRRNYVLREMFSNGAITEAAMALGCRDPARHDPLRQQREISPAGRLFHGGSAPRADQEVRREGGGRPQQPLRRRPVGAHLDGPPDAGRRRPGAARRAGQVRRRPRLARSRAQHRCLGRLGRPARPRPGRQSVFPTGARRWSCPNPEARRRSASPTAQPALFLRPRRRSPSAASAAPRSVSCGRE